MLETLFIWGLIVIPLGMAIVLILYRARLFVVGVIGIVALMMLLWAGLRFAALFDGGPEAASPVQNGSSAWFERDDGIVVFGLRMAGA